MSISSPTRYDPITGKITSLVPEPFYWGFFPWVWKRITGYRDNYGRKAQLFWEK